MISRRQLLRGRLSASPDECHPPWAIASPQFEELCIRCDVCLQSCPERIIKHNKQGYPVVDFSDTGCTFCAECVKSCDNNSLSLLAHVGADPWPLKAIISTTCVNFEGGVCRVCAEVCDSSAIDFEIRDRAAAIPIIDLDKCTGCGHCYRHCPKRSIRIKPV